MLYRPPGTEDDSLVGAGVRLCAEPDFPLQARHCGITDSGSSSVRKTCSGCSHLRPGYGNYPPRALVLVKGRLIIETSPVFMNGILYWVVFDQLFRYNTGRDLASADSFFGGIVEHDSSLACIRCRKSRPMATVKIKLRIRDKPGGSWEEKNCIQLKKTLEHNDGKFTATDRLFRLYDTRVISVKPVQVLGDAMVICIYFRDAGEPLQHSRGIYHFRTYHFSLVNLLEIDWSYDQNMFLLNQI